MKAVNFSYVFGMKNYSDMLKYILNDGADYSSERTILAGAEAGDVFSMKILAPAGDNFSK